MIKNNPKHVDFLDRSRGIAILCVFLLHAFNLSGGGDGEIPLAFTAKSLMWQMVVVLRGLSEAGVPIFFVVSGYCIHMTYEYHGQKWGSFFVRRFFRIYPPYILATLFFALIYPLTRFDILTGWRQLAYHFFLVHNLKSGASEGINPAFWSIGVEVQLYLLYPVLRKLVGWFGWWRTLSGLATLEMGMRMACVIQPGFFGACWFSGLPFSFWFSWALGAALADAQSHGHPLPLIKFSPVLWLTLALASHYFQLFEPLVFPCFAVLSTIIFGRILKGAWPRLPLPEWCYNHLRFTGFCSYSIYLLHQPLMAAMPMILNQWFSGSVNPRLLFLACILSWLMILPVAWLWYRFVEMPSIACGKYIIRNWMVQREPAVVPIT